MEILQGVWKQHLRPRAVVGYCVKIFLPSPPNYVTRSPGTNQGIDLLLLPSSFLKLLIDMRVDTPQPERLAALPFARRLTSSCCAPFVQGPNGSSV